MQTRSRNDPNAAARRAQACAVTLAWLVASVANAQAPGDAASPGTPVGADVAPAATPAETSEGRNAQTEGNETTTPAAPAPAPAPETASRTCVPNCRAGFVCVDGTCVSACNPPCPPGSVCTSEGSCVAAQPPPGEPDSLRARQRADAVARREKKQQRMEAWREAHRYDHHLTVDGFGRVTILDLDGDSSSSRFGGAAYGVLAVGYMHNFTERFGLLARGAFGVGGAFLASGVEVDAAADEWDSATPDGTLAGTIELEVVPFGGPFGGFYIGPMAFVGYRRYRDHTLVTEIDGDPVHRMRLNDRAVAGAGVGMGVFLGRRRDMHLSWFAKTSFNETLPYEAGIGFGYRFGHLYSNE